MTTTVEDRMTSETLARIEALPSLDGNALRDVENCAARGFTGYTLHARRPEGLQGDRHQRAWAIRSQRAEAAATLWLAVQAEWDRRGR